MMEYGNSPTATLMGVYPEYAWKPWSFKSVCGFIISAECMLTS